MNLNSIKRVILSAIVMMATSNSILCRPHCALGVLGLNIGCIGKGGN